MATSGTSQTWTVEEYEAAAARLGFFQSLRGKLFLCFLFLSLIPVVAMSLVALVSGAGSAISVLGYGAAAEIAALVLFHLVLGQHLTPLVDLTESMRRMANGETDVTALVASQDEVGLLARSFNRTMQGIRERMEAEQRSRHQLEALTGRYVAFVDKLAAGNLHLPLLPAVDHELVDPLARGLNELLNRMQDLARQTQQATTNITSATAQILAATSEQAASASEQAASISETTSTAEEVRQTAEQAADRARLVAETARESIAVAEQGLRAAEDTAVGINDIKEQEGTIAETILALSEQTQQVGEIIATVSDIADQSNLLALNATIEAARAGEAGKGFAVVAAEVRNLAEQSRQATVQVRDILGEIQKAANKAVMVTEEGSKRADAGVQLAHTSGRAIQGLSKRIQEAAHAAQQIAASANQQLAGVDQIAMAMGNINQAAAQTERGTRRVEEAAQNLNALAAQLTSIVKHYKLGG